MIRRRVLRMPNAETEKVEISKEMTHELWAQLDAAKAMKEISDVDMIRPAKQIAKCNIIPSTLTPSEIMRRHNYYPPAFFLENEIKANTFNVDIERQDLILGVLATSFAAKFPDKPVPSNETLFAMQHILCDQTDFGHVCYAYCSDSLYKKIARRGIHKYEYSKLCEFFKAKFPDREIPEYQQLLRMHEQYLPMKFENEYETPNCDIKCFVTNTLFWSRTLQISLKATGVPHVCSQSLIVHNCDENCSGAGTNEGRICPVSGYFKREVTSSLPPLERQFNAENAGGGAGKQKGPFTLNQKHTGVGAQDVMEQDFETGTEYDNLDDAFDEKEGGNDEMLAYVLQDTTGTHDEELMDEGITEGADNMNENTKKIVQELIRMKQNINGRSSTLQVAKRFKLMQTTAERDLYKATMLRKRSIMALRQPKKQQDMFTYMQFIVSADRRRSIYKACSKIVQDLLLNHATPSLKNMTAGQLTQTRVQMLLTVLKTDRKFNFAPNMMYNWILLESVVSMQSLKDTTGCESQLKEYYAALIFYYWHHLCSYFVGGADKVLTVSDWISHMRQFAVGILFLLTKGLIVQMTETEKKIILVKDVFATGRFPKNAKTKTTKEMNNKWNFSASSSIRTIVNTIAKDVSNENLLTKLCWSNALQSILTCRQVTDIEDAKFIALPFSECLTEDRTKPAPSGSRSLS
jgi:hypothetical protein